MDGTWHSDSKPIAVMTASGKDRFSVNRVARCDFSLRMSTNYFCSVPRTMMNDSAKKSLAHRLHEDILLAGLLLDVLPLTCCLCCNRCYPCHHPFCHQQGSPSFPNLPPKHNSGPQHWLCHCGNKVHQVVEHCLPTNALTATLPPFPSPILA